MPHYLKVEILNNTYAMPWALTAVGMSSAPYCNPMLKVMLTQNRPTIAKAALSTALSTHHHQRND